MTTTITYMGKLTKITPRDRNHYYSNTNHTLICVLKMTTMYIILPSYFILLHQTSCIIFNIPEISYTQVHRLVFIASFTFKFPSAVSRSLLQDPQKCSLIDVIKPIWPLNPSTLYAWNVIPVCTCIIFALLNISSFLAVRHYKISAFNSISSMKH